MTTSHSAGRREALRLLQPFWGRILFCVGLAAASGVATTSLLATINAAANEPEGAGAALLLPFAGLCAASIGCRAVAGLCNSRVGQEIIASLRKDIAARILSAPIETIEQRRPHRLLAVLTSDIETITAFTANVPAYAAAVALALSGFAYLFWLSGRLFALVVVAAAIGFTISAESKRRSNRDYERVRNAQDELQKQYRAITEGAKELRLNRQRRAHVQGARLSGAIERIAELRIGAMRRFWLADAICASIFFALVGGILALHRHLGIEASAVGGVILVLLYVEGPINQLIGALPLLGQAEVSFRRIASLRQDFSKVGLAGEERRDVRALRSIELRDARYAFSAAEPGDGVFTLGPIDLVIEAGETVFIVGENGSGKSTLVKLLLGLYRPTSGSLLLDGEPVVETELDSYRQRFSAVLSDYFLFEDLIATDPGALAEAAAHLDRMEIGHKVAIEDGRFSTIDLSTGQRKRLALVHACLERRPIMVLDEWAADQDPSFRRFYYTEVLPELKARGKTLIVVSHDDRYFDWADRVIRIEKGRIVRDARREVSPERRCGAAGPRVAEPAIPR
jgi:putative ATP-binding cassette transporter